MRVQIFRMTAKVRVRDTPYACYGRESCQWRNHSSLNWLTPINPITSGRERRAEHEKPVFNRWKGSEAVCACNYTNVGAIPCGRPSEYTA